MPGAMMTHTQRVKFVKAGNAIIAIAGIIVAFWISADMPVLAAINLALASANIYFFIRLESGQ
jgi:uncharacterized membrane protein